MPYTNMITPKEAINIVNRFFLFFWCSSELSLLALRMIMTTITRPAPYWAMTSSILGVFPNVPEVEDFWARVINIRPLMHQDVAFQSHVHVYQWTKSSITSIYTQN